MQNPRESALDVLMKVDKKEALSHIAIGETLEKYQFSDKKDRAFFTRLCQGTLERRLTIDYVINQYSKMKVNKLKPLVFVWAFTRSCIWIRFRIPQPAMNVSSLRKKEAFQNCQGLSTGF